MSFEINREASSLVWRPRALFSPGFPLPCGGANFFVCNMVLFLTFRCFMLYSNVSTLNFRVETLEYNITIFIFTMEQITVCNEKVTV